MRIVKSAAAMQRMARRWRTRGMRVGLVPTMGYLHEGHLSLIHRARRAVGRRGVVVVSLYVNPTQFGPKEDLSRYPRDFSRDRKLCGAAGVDVLFAPDDQQMYPRNGADAFSTVVAEESLSRIMEGAARPGHFCGVTTIVAKLLNLVMPDLAVFGAKDFQQAAVVQRMARDLNFPVKILVAPTVREPDGLALSSRNKYLDATQRRSAAVLYEALQLAGKLSRRGGMPAGALKKRLTQFIAQRPGARLDNIEVFDPKTLQPVRRAGRGSQVALAVYFGKTRLIDNARL